MKITNLTLAAALTALPATMALADTGPFQFYGGAQGAYTFSKTKFDTVSVNTGNNPTTTTSVKASKKQNFASGGVFVGTRYFYGDFFAGLEFEANFDRFKIKQNQLDLNNGVTPDDAWKLELKRRSHFVPSVTLGWKANESVALYTKLGAGISKFEIVEGRGEISYNKQNRTIVHFVPALGVEYSVHDNAALRFEVAGEVAGKSIKGNSQTPGAAAFQNTKTRYSAFSMKLGVLVKV